MFKSYDMELAGRKLVIESGKIAGLTNGSVVVKYGDTVVMVNVTASKEPRDGIDFFPLSVDYEEKLYAVGKIPGSYLKREGKPSDKAILTSRAIDRPLRPLFPKDFRNDVCVVATALSVEQDNSPEVAAMIGASAALSISDIPFGGPTAAVNVGYVNGKIVINPTQDQREISDLTLTVAGTKEKIAMIEAGANEIPNDIMLEAIKAGHKEIIKVCEFIEKIKENYYNDNKDSQLMLLPDIITLTHKEMEIARDNMKMFRKAGFMLEEFGENTIKLTGVPEMCLDLETKEMFLETLDEINSVSRTAKQEVEERFIATVACKAAVKANMALTKEEVDSLMDKLLELPNPFTCPHGRPTAIKMSKYDIERKFARK